MRKEGGEWKLFLKRSAAFEAARENCFSVGQFDREPTLCER